MPSPLQMVTVLVAVSFWPVLGSRSPGLQLRAPPLQLQYEGAAAGGGGGGGGWALAAAAMMRSDNEPLMWAGSCS
eukprot:COSAG01_NODE_8859_length_2634_cov_2.226735_2_plen_75_part_00